MGNTHDELNNTNNEYLNSIIEELKCAQKLQINTLPDELSEKDISIKGIYMPFEYLGGDFYYWQKVEENKYAVILMDVMGHGTSTAMICMYLRALLPAMIISYPEPVNLIKKLNKTLIKFNNQIGFMDYHMTALYFLVDTKNGSLCYVNAAHPNGIFMDSDQNIRLMDKGCIPLGIFPDISPDSEIIRFEKKVNVFVYSDGLYQLIQDNNLQIDYFINYVKYYGDTELDNSEKLQKLSSLIKMFSTDDDISLVCAEIKGVDSYVV